MSKGLPHRLEMPLHVTNTAPVGEVSFGIKPQNRLLLFCGAAGSEAPTPSMLLFFVAVAGVVSYFETINRLCCFVFRFLGGGPYFEPTHINLMGRRVARQPRYGPGAELVPSRAHVRRGRRGAQVISGRPIWDVQVTLTCPK